MLPGEKQSLGKAEWQKPNKIQVGPFQHNLINGVIFIELLDKVVTVSFKSSQFGWIIFGYKQNFLLHSSDRIDIENVAYLETFEFRIRYAYRNF